MAQNVRPVFLSASVPRPGRDPKYLVDLDVVAIAAAVRALVRVVLPNGRLVFGGHPAISPFVLEAAATLGSHALDCVVMYQSEWYRSVIPQDHQVFPRLTWTPAGADAAESLKVMRTRMLTDAPPIAGVFIGGMDGVEDEFALFRRHRPEAPAFPVASTGSAARIVFDDHPNLHDARTRERLRRDRRYEALFRDLLGIADA